MNRRAFLLGGGALTGVIAAIRRSAQPEGSVDTCSGAHTPHPGYIKSPALAMGLSSEKDGIRDLVPCKVCGVLFALTRKQS